MGDSFRFSAVVAKTILMLANLMQISIKAAFTETEPDYDDLSVPKWKGVFNFDGNRFFY